ncbi:MAG TPA: IS1595 family transposase [Bacilli bacterium]
MNQEMKQNTGLEEFLARFHSEEVCVDYLIQMKWPNGFSCDRCGCRDVYLTETRRLPLFECVVCRYQASPIVGTIMEGSSTPLRKWFLALYLLSQENIKTNAIELSRIIHVGYKTGWLIAHKIRHAMGKADAEVQLTGDVNITSAIYGHPSNSHSFDRLPQESPALVGATMNSFQEPQYVKIKLISDEHLKEKDIMGSGLKAFAAENVEESAATDYNIKQYAPMSQRPTYPLFKASRRWIHATFHGLGKRHLQSYLNEFCYRLNMKFRKTVSIFEELMQLCTSIRTITYTKLTI